MRVGVWEWGLLERCTLTPNVWRLLTSSARSEPSCQANAFCPHAPGLVTGRAFSQMGLQGHLSHSAQPEGFLEAGGVNGECARLLGRHQELGGCDDDGQCLHLVDTQLVAAILIIPYRKG